MNKSILVFRLSSFGDLILSTAFLENLPSHFTVDWVISKEFKWVLEGHPRIRTLIVYDKKTKLKGWFQLLMKLKNNQYDAWFDLHVTLRTKFASLVAWFFGISWHSISKERFRHFAALIFKGKTPPEWKPTPYWVRFGKLARSLSHSSVTLRPPAFPQVLRFGQEAWLNWLIENKISAKKFAVAMPASRWDSKQWGVSRFLETMKQCPPDWIWVVVGRTTDRACVELVKQGRSSGLTILSLIDEPRFDLVAKIIQSSNVLLSNDTGFVHLAEALGTRVVAMFGPTHPVLGFGPWKPESKSMVAHVFCSPCSKDGRHCFRVWNRYACLRSHHLEEVVQAVTGEMK